MGQSENGSKDVEEKDEFGRSRDYHTLKSRADRRDIQKSREALRRKNRLRRLGQQIHLVTSDSLITEIDNGRTKEPVGIIIYGSLSSSSIDDGIEADQNYRDISKEIEVYGVEGWASDEDGAMTDEEEQSDEEARIKMYWKNKGKRYESRL